VDWNSLVSTTVNQVAPNNPLENNIASPILSAANNKTWYGGDIVGKRLSKLPEREQYDESTDSLSKFIGNALNISPKKINYVLDQYSGGIGDVILPMFTPQAENNILEDKFTTDAVMKNKSVSEFYSTLEEIEKKKNSIHATDEDKLKYKYLYNTSLNLSDLYKEKRQIQNSDLKDDEKKEQVREVQKNINNIVKDALSHINNMKNDTNTAIIGDKEYSKDNKGQWNSLSEKEMTKNKDISLETFNDYKNKVSAMTQNKRVSGELNKNAQLRDKDKIDILLKSNYSSKEKQAIYESYIVSSTDETYPLIKKFFTDDKLNIEKYLKYKNTSFESNKKDDGTIKGKPISGSKKNKEYDYVEKMDITYTQKLLLLGTQYKLKSNERETMVKFIQNSDKITDDEKLELYGKLKGFTVYKNGRVTY